MAYNTHNIDFKEIKKFKIFRKKRKKTKKSRFFRQKPKNEMLKKSRFLCRKRQRQKTYLISLSPMTRFLRRNLFTVAYRPRVVPHLTPENDAMFASALVLLLKPSHQLLPPRHSRRSRTSKTTHRQSGNYGSKDSSSLAQNAQEL